MNSLESKVALVTGAASKRGMGHAVALRLAKEGANVVVVDKYLVPRSSFSADKEWSGLDTVVAEIKSLGKEALAVAADVSSSPEVNQTVAKALERFKKIDILVHCASTRGPMSTPIVELAEGDWKGILDVNLTGSFLISKAVAKSMIDKGEGGKIVLISSLGGTKGMPGSGAYCASKFGVIGLVKTLALELAPNKINVNAINPGHFATSLRDDTYIAQGQAEGITADEARERYNQKAIPTIPMGRLGTADEIAELALFLVSNQSSYITGEAINITGGVS